MTIENIFLPRTNFLVLRDAEGEGGAGGGEGETKDTGGDTGTGLGKDAPTGIGDADENGGGTAEGQDNSGEGDGGKPKEGDKPDGGEPDKGDKPKDGEAPKEGEQEGEGDVPETYEFTDLPEGVEVDQGLSDAVTPVFKDLGLTQEQANKLVGAYAEHVKAQADGQLEAVTQMITGWRDTAKADKEVGGGNWQASVDAANAVIRQFGTPELVSDVMVGQGIGNHPEVIRLLARIGKSISEDTLDVGNPTDTGGTVPQEVSWYGNTTPTKRT